MGRAPAILRNYYRGKKPFAAVLRELNPLLKTVARV
jgi:hypothetical protein